MSNRTNTTKLIRPVAECLGCARDRKTRCEIIEEPGYFWGKYGRCFAMVTAEQARQIEQQIRINMGQIKGVGRCRQKA